MNWNTVYHTYEGLAMMVITTIWGIMLLEPAAAKKADYQSINGQFNQAWQHVFVRNQYALEDLCTDVRKQGNSREGKERIKRAEELNKRINLVQQKINKIRNDRSRNNFVGEFDVVLLVNEQLLWINQEFKDLELPYFEQLKYPVSTNYFSFTSPESIKTSLWLYQLRLERYKRKVLRKLGAYDIAYYGGCGFYSGDMVINQAYVVQVGDEYTADMFHTGWRRIYDVNFYVDNQNVETAHRGRIEFKTEGSGQKYLDCIFSYRKKYRGRTYNIKKKIPYTVIPK